MTTFTQTESVKGWNFKQVSVAAFYTVLCSTTSQVGLTRHLAMILCTFGFPAPEQAGLMEYRGQGNPLPQILGLDRIEFY